MADSWGPREERLHPRDAEGKFRGRGGSPLGRSEAWVQRISDDVAQRRGELSPDGQDLADELEGSEWAGDDTDYYHGTTLSLDDGDFDQGDGDLIQPPNIHRGGVVFPNMTDANFAYATTSESDAWHYAQLAYNNSARGRPRVYRVRATGPVEADLELDQYGNSRGIFSADLRSRHPFEILEEVSPPEHMQRYEEDEDEWN